MDRRQINLRSALWSVLLHGGLLCALALMALPCTRFEAFFEGVGLPTWLSPVTCSKPLVMAGPVIEATLVGPAATTHKKPAPHKSPPQPKPQDKPATTPEKPPVKTLPPPPKNPALTDQQKVVALADKQAEQARREQQERERQRQSELEADKLLAQLDKLKRQSAEADRKSRLEQQRLQQLADLQKASEADNVPEADQARSGGGGQENSLIGEYAAALTTTITQNWLRPDNIPAGVVCPIHIEQIPGGQVISVRVLPSCPFDEPGRRSVKNAVLRAQPLPYKGYQSVFQRDITLNFKVTE